MKSNVEHDRNKCPFCDIDRTKTYNTILEETKYFYVLPALGSLVDGYVLIISKRHINSMINLEKYELKEYKRIIKKYRKIFKKIYGIYPIVFEHGTPYLKSKFKANSINHAHTHIVNHKFNNENDLLLNLNFKNIVKIDKINEKYNYILYINQNNKKYVTYDFEIKSEVMRLKIAEDLNLITKYDWNKYKFEDNINKTINNINKYLKK